MLSLFSKILKSIYNQRDDELLSKYDRSLPFQDAMIDRWERADKLGFNKGASIYNSALVFGQVRVGSHTWIGPNVMLDGSGGELTIGQYCSVSTGVQIYTHDTVGRSLSGGVEPIYKAPVSVGNNTYIGSAAIIASGVKIGSKAVIAANSFVNEDVPDRWIVGGSPARKLGEVTFNEQGKPILDYSMK